MLPAQHRQMSILLYGDSNTWGFVPMGSVESRLPTRIPYKQRWTTLLQEKLLTEHVIVEALNARTTIFDDMCSPCDGEYDCNGRRYLTTLLHSHKPLKLIVLALGTNDLKQKFNTTPNDIVSGIRVLVRDIQRATLIGLGDESPKILVLGPPVIHSTNTSKMWGFIEGSDSKSKKLSSLLAVATADMKINYLNLSTIASVSQLDGVHFDVTTQKSIADAVATKVKPLLDYY